MKINTGSLSQRREKTTKHMFLRIAVLAILVAVAGVWGFSKDRGGAGRDFTFKMFKGTVSAVDASHHTITVVKGKRNNQTSMTFDVTEGEVEWRDKQMKLSSVEKGNIVRVHYSEKDGVFKARRISVK